MVNHCENCNCESRKILRIENTFVKIVLIISFIIFIATTVILIQITLNLTFDWWRHPDYAAFAALYSSFAICYGLVFDVTVKPLECMWAFIVWLCPSMWGGMRNIWNRLRLLTWSDNRLMFSMRRVVTITHPQQEISISDNESVEERPPPLPPRNKSVVEASRTTMFQKLTPKVSQGDSSSTASEDESSDLSSSLLHRPHCSKQSAPSLESSRRRSKKLSKREHFKNMMSKVTNLNAIREEDLGAQGASGVEVPLSSLAQKSASDTEIEQETSFTAEPHQSGAAEQHFNYVNIDETDEKAPTQRVYGGQVQEKTSNTGDKKRDPDETSTSSLRSTKQQLSAVQRSVRQSAEEPSTSGHVPVFKLWNQTSSPKKLAFIGAPISKFGTRAKFLQSSPQQVWYRNVPLSTLKKQSHGQTLAVVHSGSQEKVRASDIQCESSATCIKLPELESQSMPFGTGSTDGNQISLHQPPSSAHLQVPLSQTQEQISASAFSGSQEQSRLSDIQSSQGNRDQAASSYVKLAQLEKLLSVSCIRTERKQSSPEHSALGDVQISLHSQVSSISGIQRMPTYQGQTSSTDDYDLQRLGRVSDVQRRRSSRKHTPIPNYKKAFGAKRESWEERLNLQQPMESCVQFSLSKNQRRASGTGEVHEFSSQEKGLQEMTLREEISVPQGESGTSNTLEKLRILQQASIAGFLEAVASHFGGAYELPQLTNYAGERFRGKAERAATQKRRGSLSIGSERPIRESNIRTKRTEGSIESTSQLSACTRGGLETSSIQRQQIAASGGGYLPHSILSGSGGTPTQAHTAAIPLNKRKEGEDQIRQPSSRDPSHLKETDKQETQRKETFVTLDLATGGIVLSSYEVEDETEAAFIEPSMDVLDLSHIEVPLSPKYKDESQTSEKPICQSSTRTKRTESTSQLSAFPRGGLGNSSSQRQQVGASRGGYLPHSTLSKSGGTPTQTHVATTPLNKGKEGEDRTRQLSSGDSSRLKETDKQETKRKGTFLTRGLATGGLVLSKDGAEDNETEADSSEPLFKYDQSMQILDLSHIEVPLSPQYLKSSKDKGESQTLERSIHQSTTRTKRTERSAESTSQSSAFPRGGLGNSSSQRQQVEASRGGYLPHSTLSRPGGTPTQTHAATTPLNKLKEGEGRIRQQSSEDPSHLKEIEKQETKRKTFLTRHLATGGLVLSKDGAKDEETEDDSSELSTGVLDLSHIEIPLPPKDIKPSKEKDEYQN